jgi:hypothetical protein
MPKKKQTADGKKRKDQMEVQKREITDIVIYFREMAING